jgi:hypothetical protein
MFSLNDTRLTWRCSSNFTVSSRLSKERVMRLNSVTTNVSAGRTYSISRSQPGRSIREPVVLSEKIFSHSAFCNASTCESKFWPTLLTRAQSNRCSEGGERKAVGLFQGKAAVLRLRAGRGPRRSAPHPPVFVRLFDRFPQRLWRRSKSIARFIVILCSRGFNAYPLLVTPLWNRA